MMYLVLQIKTLALNARQTNFIDSVTHELKSPIASLKLYLQTLTRHQVSREQEADFFRYMLDDVDRLDHLINHMLEVARVERGSASSAVLMMMRSGAAIGIVEQVDQDATRMLFDRQAARRSTHISMDRGFADGCVKPSRRITRVGARGRG